MTSSNDNNNNVLEKVQEIISTAILQVANDYDILFAPIESKVENKVGNKNADETADDSADSSFGADFLSERHKQGKVILSHLEALLKINATYIEKAPNEIPVDYKKLLVQTARKDLKEKS